MAGRGTRAKAPAPPEKQPPPRAASAAASGRAAAAPASGRAAAPAASPGKAKKGGAAPTDDARKEALAEAEGMAQAVADEEITDKHASPPPAAKRSGSDRATTLELQREKAERKAERAKLLAETERLRKELDAYTVRESKRKQREAAEPAPPAKRAAGSGRRTAPQSAAVSRRRLSVCTSISVIDFFVT